MSSPVGVVPGPAPIMSARTGSGASESAPFARSAARDRTPVRPPSKSEKAAGVSRASSAIAVDTASIVAASSSWGASTKSRGSSTVSTAHRERSMSAPSPAAAKSARIRANWAESEMLRPPGVTPPARLVMVSNVGRRDVGCATEFPRLSTIADCPRWTTRDGRAKTMFPRLASMRATRGAAIIAIISILMNSRVIGSAVARSGTDDNRSRDCPKETKGFTWAL